LSSAWSDNVLTSIRRIMSGACSPPSPSSPWQVAHLGSKTLFPLSSVCEVRAGCTLFDFWQRAVPIAPKNISTNPTLDTTRQVMSRFS
jgi:hypothetical protein